MNKPTTELKPTWIDLNRNENAMKSVLKGVDLYDRLGRKKPSKGGQQKQETATGGKYLIKGTEYTLEELKGMGYTEEQVAKYKQ